MFSKFKEIEEKQEFEMLENGYVLRVNGRDQNDSWLQQAFIFTTLQDLFAAIDELGQVR